MSIERFSIREMREQGVERGDSEGGVAVKLDALDLGRVVSALDTSGSRESVLELGSSLCLRRVLA